MKSSNKKSVRLNVTMPTKLYKQYKSACKKKKTSMMAKSRSLFEAFIGYVADEGKV
jgi:hypothetical protein